MKWTTERETEFRALVDAKFTAQQISAHMGATVRSIRYKAHHLGITLKAGKKASDWAEIEYEFRSMIAAGLSSREIAGHLGMTRNAVVGKAHRLGLHIRAEEMEAQKAARAQRGAYKKPYQYRARPNRRQATTWMDRIMARQLGLEYAPSTVLDGVGTVAFLDIEPDQCRWPSGDGAGMLFCGEPSVKGRPYCRCHLGMAYKPRMDLSEDERRRRSDHGRNVLTLWRLSQRINVDVAA